jgi:putative hydrolase of the HAD superfamily
MVRGVIFDFFGTLTDGRYELQRSALYRQVALALAVPEESFLRVMRESFDRRMAGAFGSPRETLVAMCAMLGALPGAEALDAALALRLSIERHLATPRAEAVPVLRALRSRGMPVGMISDCGPETAVIWPDHPCAEFIAATVFSFAEGRRKPDPILYRLAASHLGLPPQACLYVGDGGSRELSGARDVGMRVVKLAAPGEDWQEELRYDPEESWEGATVTSLLKIPPLLDRILAGPESDPASHAKQAAHENRGIF